MRWLDGITDSVDMNLIEEFKEKVPGKIDFMTSSCCPAFVEQVKKHFPEFKENIYLMSQSRSGIVILDNFFSSVQFSHSVMSDSL